MNLVRFDPFRELEQMSARLNSLFGRTAGSPAENGVDGFIAWTPAIDVQETDAEYLIKADLPEIARNDVKVGIDDGVLTVEGERKQEKEEKGKKFHRVERSYGSFMRTFALPENVDDARLTAEYKDGVLHVRLPKTERAKPKAIAVKVS